MCIWCFRRRQISHTLSVQPSPKLTPREAGRPETVQRKVGIHGEGLKRCKLSFASELCFKHLVELEVDHVETRVVAGQGTAAALKTESTVMGFPFSFIVRTE